jgi:hypothetical protein
MTKQIAASDLKPGMTYMTHYGPRVITAVEFVTERGRRWFKWFWEPQQRLDGGTDCGFGGVIAQEAGALMVNVDD